MGKVSACIQCGEPTTNGSRCVRCNRGYHRGVRNRLHTRPEWRHHRKRVLAAHRERYGDTCPAYLVSPHSSTRLSVDHIRPLSKGGALLGPTQVLCVACNSRKRNRE